jgi:hypothetical protein
MRLTIKVPCQFLWPPRAQTVEDECDVSSSLAYISSWNVSTQKLETKGFYVCFSGLQGLETELAGMHTLFLLPSSKSYIISSSNIISSNTQNIQIHTLCLSLRLGLFKNPSRQHMFLFSCFE